MLGLFETVLNLSMMGSVMILLIMIVRRLLRRIPTKYIYGLWALAVYRLLCPKSPASILSLFNFLPKKKISFVSASGAIGQTTAATSSNVNALERSIRQVTPQATSAVSSTAKASGGSALDIWQVLMVLWILGMAVLAIVILIKSITMYRSLRDTRKIEGNVYSGPSISSPFVIGILKPRIFMPQGLSEKEYSYLLHHEQTHLRRHDMVFKTIWIAALLAHWFNPLVWIAFRLFESDMEMSCDEEVIKNISSDLRADYCMSLVSYARKSNSPKYLVSPLGFGKENVKARIKNVMNYKKLSLWVSIVCAVAVGAIFTCGFLNPVDKKIIAQEESSVTEVSAQLAAKQSPVKETSESTEATETVATETVKTESETNETLQADPTSAIPSSEAFSEDEEDYESFSKRMEDEPLWGTPEWIEKHQNKTIPETPDVSMSDRELFDLSLPQPDKEILFRCNLEKGATFAPDSLGDFTQVYAVVGETNPSDLIFIATEELSGAELESYVQALREIGFIDVVSGDQTYMGYTEDGCYVIIESCGDIEKYTTIRFSSSTSTDNDSMGVG